MRCGVRSRVVVCLSVCYTTLTFPCVFLKNELTGTAAGAGAAPEPGAADTKRQSKKKKKLHGGPVHLNITRWVVTHQTQRTLLLKHTQRCSRPSPLCCVVLLCCAHYYNYCCTCCCCAVCSLVTAVLYCTCTYTAVNGLLCHPPLSSIIVRACDVHAHTRDPHCTMSSDKDEKVPKGDPLSISEWARAQRELLKLERDEEISQVADTIAQLTAQVSCHIISYVRECDTRQNVRMLDCCASNFIFSILQILLSSQRV